MSKKTSDLSKDVEAFILDRKAQRMAKGTLHFYRSKLNLFITYAIGQGVGDVEHITPALIRGYILDMENKGHNAGGCHACYRTLKTFLLWWEAENEPMDWKNPIRKTKPPKQDDEPLDPVEFSDVDALLDTCGGDFFGTRDKAIMRVLLDTGVRAFEMTAFDLVDLDLGDSSLFVRKGKGRKARTVYIGKKSRRALRAWLRQRGSDPGALFTTQDGERLTYWGLREIIRRRAKDARIEQPGLHDFRRAFTLAQLRAGVDILTISRLLGHTSTVLVARYAKQKPQDLKDKYKSPVDDGGE
ncbi:MAG: tyrosine-type recombinase/integrase [Chloroflexota bacterium]